MCDYHMHETARICPVTAGYYGQGQFSLFRVIIYIKEGDNVCSIYVLATPENDHSC